MIYACPIGEDLLFYEWGTYSYVRGSDATYLRDIIVGSIAHFFDKGTIIS